MPIELMRNGERVTVDRYRYGCHNRPSRPANDGFLRPECRYQLEHDDPACHGCRWKGGEK